MAKKKSKKQDKKKKKDKKKILSLKNDKTRRLKKKKKGSDKKKGKKKEEKKKLGKKKEEKKKTAVEAEPVKGERNIPAKSEKAVKPEKERSSNYNVKDAVIKLRALGSKEEILAFTKGEKRVSITRVIPAVLNRFKN